MQDVVPLVIGVLGVLLSLFLVWRGYTHLTDAPPCAELAEVAGPAREISLKQRFYSARWLEVSIEGQPMYVPASAFVLPSVQPLRVGAQSVARFCPGPRRGSRVRLWELSVDGRTIFDVSDWRTFANGQARVMGAASVLFVLLASFGFRLSRRVA